MEQAHVLNWVESLYKRLTTPTGRVRYAIVLRDGKVIISMQGELEAGDIIIVPPSVVTKDTPTSGYIRGCIEKCWSQIKVFKL